MEPTRPVDSNFDGQRRTATLSLNSVIETADSADFTDFEGAIWDERTNLFVKRRVIP
jgi:hypothetical protein